MSFTVEAVLSITFILRAVLCAVRIKLQKRNYFSQSSALLYDHFISPRTSSSSIEMPESGYNIFLKRGSENIHLLSTCIVGWEFSDYTAELYTPMAFKIINESLYYSYKITSHRKKNNFYIREPQWFPRLWKLIHISHALKLLVLSLVSGPGNHLYSPQNELW